MTVVLRLQGLDAKAGTEDIRTFFKCFRIPDGGVFIAGGSLREAFIAFTTEREAKLAMRHTGQPLKGSPVSLHISSMDEMEHKLMAVLKRRKPSPAQLTEQPPPDANLKPLKARSRAQKTARLPPAKRLKHNRRGPDLPPTKALKLDPRSPDLPPSKAVKHDPRTASLSLTTTSKVDPRTANPQPLQPDTANLHSPDAIDSGTAFLLGICTVLQGLQSSQKRENNEPVPEVNFSKTHSTVVTEVRTPEQTLCSKPGYVRLFGLPASTTKEDICHFFKGLSVQEAIVNVELGLGHGCLVKFASEQEASEALLFNQQSLGSIHVEVRGATEKMWTGALQECENACDGGERVKSKQSPLRETANHKQNPAALQTRRPAMKRSSPELSKKPRLDGDLATAASPTMEYTVKVSNIPNTMTKTEIKELLGCPNVAHKNVLHLLDAEGNRTDTAFLILNRTEDYEYALNLTGCHVGSNTINVSSITRKIMRDMMAKTHPRNLDPDTRRRPNRKTRSLPVEMLEDTPSTDPAAQTCLFVRNMPGDVEKCQIANLFRTFRVKKDSITLLLDSDGKGIGEAVVQFKSQKLAALAQRLHGQNFMGSKVILTCINVKQMEDILARSA